MLLNTLEIAYAKPGPQADLPITAGKGEIVIALSAPRAALPAYLSEHRALMLAPASYAPDGSGVAIIGTGSYRMTEPTSPLNLAAETFPDHWGEQAAIANVTDRGVGRIEARALSAKSGDADFVFGLDPASITRPAPSDAVESLTTSAPRTLLLKLDAELPALSDPEARRALRRAIDRGAEQIPTPALDGWRNDALTPLEYGSKVATCALAALGWVPGPNGNLTRDGERFALNLTIYSDRPEPLPVPAALQQLRALRVEMALNVTNFSDIPAGHADGSPQMGLVAHGLGTIPDPVGIIHADFVTGAG